MVFSFESDTVKVVAIGLLQQAVRFPKALSLKAVCKHFYLHSDSMDVNK
jgi:hypothetical protein